MCTLIGLESKKPCLQFYANLIRTTHTTVTDKNSLTHQALAGVCNAPINEISARWKTLPTHWGTLPTHWGRLSTHWEIISTRWKHSPTHWISLQRVFNAFLNAFSTDFRLISYAGFSQIGSHINLGLKESFFNYLNLGGKSSRLLWAK